MKKFFNDYVELYKHNLMFYKEHWLGMTVLTVASCAVSVVIAASPVIKEKIEDKIDEIKNKDK